MMDKKKNKLVEVHLITILIVMAVTVATLVFVVHAPWMLVVEEVLNQVCYASLTLLCWEPLYLRYCAQHKLPRTYKINFMLFLVALLFFYAGVHVKTVLWCLVDWGFAILFGVVGLVFFYKVIGHEAEIEQKSEQAEWEKKKKLYEKTGMTAAQIADDAGRFLRFYTEGDSLEGRLDMARPLCPAGLTLTEMVERHAGDPLTEKAELWLAKAAQDYAKAHGTAATVEKQPATVEKKEEA